MHDAREWQVGLSREPADLLGRELWRERRARDAVVLEEGERLLVEGDQRVVGVDGEVRQAPHERERADVVDVDGVGREGGKGGEQGLEVLLLAVVHDARRVEVDARTGLLRQLPGLLVLLGCDDMVMVRIAAKQDAVGTGRERGLDLRERRDGNEEGCLPRHWPLLAVLELRLGAVLARLDLLEAQLVERFDGLTARLVDLAHRHHDLALDIAAERRHLVDAGAEAADLLADHIFGERPLARGLADEIGLALGPMPLGISDRHGQWLADGGVDGDGYRDAAHRCTRRIRLLGALHQAGVVDLKDTVVVAHGGRNRKQDGVAGLAL